MILIHRKDFLIVFVGIGVVTSGLVSILRPNWGTTIRGESLKNFRRICAIGRIVGGGLMLIGKLIELIEFLYPNPN